MRRHAGSFSRARVAHFAAWFGTLAAGCVGVPEPPPVTEDLSALNAKYEHPTAVLPDDVVHQLVAAARASLGNEALLTGLDFTRNHINETSIGLAAHANVEELDLQGSVRASFDCPGDDTPEAVAAGPGKVSALFGVERSTLRRGFRGTMRGCRFPIVTTFGDRAHVTLSAEFFADLGGNLALGESVPGSVLVHLVRPTGSAMTDLGEIDLSRDEYAFRLTDTGSLELLVEAIDLGGENFGSLVIVVGKSGLFGLRESRGQWDCGSEDEPCILAR